MINASIFLEICALSALWPADAGWSSADQTMSEVTLPLFKDLARDEGLLLSDVPSGPSGTELVGDLLTSWPAARHWGAISSKLLPGPPSPHP